MVTSRLGGQVGGATRMRVRDESGMTLVELVVVITIIGV
ncbi:MAG: hypothetical protein DMD79_02225, partial [Candidatus Rokuibacteriota bacterium]